MLPLPSFFLGVFRTNYDDDEDGRICFPLMFSYTYAADIHLKKNCVA